MQINDLFGAAAAFETVRMPDGTEAAIPAEHAAVIYVNEQYQMITGLFRPIALGDIFPYMAGTAGALGVGIGCFGEWLWIHRHLKV